MKLQIQTSVSITIRARLKKSLNFKVKPVIDANKKQALHTLATQKTPENYPFHRLLMVGWEGFEPPASNAPGWNHRPYYPFLYAS